jgi:hypothetical protein
LLAAQAAANNDPTVARNDPKPSLTGPTAYATAHETRLPPARPGHPQAASRSKTRKGPTDFTAVKPPEGRVHMFSVFDTAFALAYLQELTPATQDFIVDRYERGVAYAPYFDTYTTWYANAWEYEDLYAIYNCGAFACSDYFAERTAYILEQHPEWILRGEDEQGQSTPRYLPSGCQPAGCPQYAADVGNPEFRQFWIDAVAENLEAAEDAGFGYRGIFVDDVNLDLNRSVVRVLPGPSKNAVTAPGDPIDPRTGAVMTAQAWQDYLADFLEEIRAAFPHREIVINPVWYFSDPTDEAWLRAVDAADIVNFERGLLGDGFTPGYGTFGVASFLAMNDVVHARNRRLAHYIHAPEAASADEEERMLEYGLAGWLLASDGRDFFGSQVRSTPGDWWSGFDIDLGRALGDRTYDEDIGIHAREFQRGIVLLREPVAAGDSMMIDLGEPYLDAQGAIVWSVALAPRTAAVLRRVIASDSFKLAP